MQKRNIPKDMTYAGAFYAAGYRDVPDEFAHVLDERFGEGVKAEPSQNQALEQRVNDLGDLLNAERQFNREKTALLTLAESKVASLEKDLQKLRDEYSALEARYSDNQKTILHGKTSDVVYVATQDNPHPIGSSDWFKYELKANGQQVLGNPSLETLKKRLDEFKGL